MSNEIRDFGEKPRNKSRIGWKIRAIAIALAAAAVYISGYISKKDEIIAKGYQTAAMSIEDRASSVFSYKGPWEDRIIRYGDNPRKMLDAYPGVPDYWERQIEHKNGLQMEKMAPCRRYQFPVLEK
ncbi:MAG: hypothetical protein HZB67_02970 [Candidatus Aenigmarchaeota archaeon]|nr:hypothetical protein [Candidatus Aenigmarchaeota archaeon]